MKKRWYQVPEESIGKWWEGLLILFWLVWLWIA